MARDLGWFPAPPDAPPQGACVRVERPELGLAVIVLDPPHRRLAVLDVPLMRDLEAVLDRLAQEAGLQGLVVAGRDPLSFAAGADLDALERIEGASLASELARFGQEVFQKLASLRAFKVAAVGGPVPGGAFELALACDRIVLADHPSTRIGLPETQLGILPGWGGCQRLPRRVGVPASLEAILSGKLHPPRQALKLGLVDRLTWPEYLRGVACEIATGRAPCRRFSRGAWRYLVDRNPLAIALIAKKALQQVRERTGGHYPAPEQALRLVVSAPSTPLAQGLAREAEALGNLAVSTPCKSLVRLFRTAEDAKRLARGKDGAEGPAFQRAGVVGAGVMGGSIAGLLAEKGVDVRLADVSGDALDAAVRAHRERVGKALARRILLPHQARAAVDRLETSAEISGFRQCQIVIEAVAERLDVKRKVFADLARELRDDAILATNTSSLSVDSIAEGVPHPERVVGMHFFNPVQQMPLVEVVRGRRTSEEALGGAARLAVQLGKTPVVVRDVAGFLVNRVLGPYLDEATRLLEAGVEAERVERVAKEFGMPMGPLELLDEVGFDIAVHAAASLEAAYGERMQPAAVLGRMVEAGVKGKKGGEGFWVWRRERGKVVKGRIRGDLGRFVQVRRTRYLDVSDAGAVDQMVLSMVNEAARCLEEGVVATAKELDLATVYGMGFAPFRGGVLRYADSRGARDVVSALRRLWEAPDVIARQGGRERFLPCRLLQEMAEREGRFHA